MQQPKTTIKIYYHMVSVGQLSWMVLAQESHMKLLIKMSARPGQCGVG